MMHPSPKSKRHHQGLQARDVRPSPRPEPRNTKKHALNPPIVTIFGAGVAGLTAAHELVERGFIVQVIEEQEDPYTPGRPIVGGMAANQPARVRANVEDLHRELLTISQNEGNDQAGVAAWLLELFSFNRSRWVQTEQPVRSHNQLYSFPYADEENNKKEEHAEVGAALSPFTQTLFKSLDRMRERYRTRWCWDLVVRGVALGAIKPAEVVGDPLAAARQAYEGLMRSGSNLAMAEWVLPYHKELPGVPTSAELAANKALVEAAFEREFLCFRLVPYARSGFETYAIRTAQKLLRLWGPLLKHRFGASCLDVPEPFALEVGDAPPETAQLAWLQIEFVEQRLPGEHGYRFFPSFYRHLDDTMRRTPLFDGDRPTGRSVSDNLKPTVSQAIAFTRDDLPYDLHLYDNREPPRRNDERREPSSYVNVPLSRQRPDSVEALRDQTERFVRRLGGTARDTALLTAKLVRLMMMSAERRRHELECESWRDFIELEQFSEPIQKQIRSAAQALLAFSEGEADARTYGNVVIQILLDGMLDGGRTDRTLNGPTSDAWLEPWREYLERQGVRFFCLRLAGLSRETANQELVPILEVPSSKDDAKDQIAQNGSALLHHATSLPGLKPDFYVLALSFERTRELLAGLDSSDEEAAPDFAKFREFAADVDKLDALKDMTGVQFFFDAKTSIGDGHMYFPYSPWGLSSISQSEFWSRRRGFADGYFGLLSVDICTTGYFQDPQPGSFWKLVKDASAAHPALPPGPVDAPEPQPGPGFQVARETWRQLEPLISPKDRLAEPRCFHVDRNISGTGNSTKFLGSVAKLDEHRPGRAAKFNVGREEVRYSLNFRRWVMCGTFMATHTRLTTMEAANESARHAVCVILDALANDDAVEPLDTGSDFGRVRIESLVNRTYNGAYKHRVFDKPDIWPLEERELADLQIFRRVDRRLFELGLPHFMDIIDFDRKLLHALESMELYGRGKPLNELLGLAISGLDATLVTEYGSGYAAAATDYRRNVKQSIAALQGALPSPTFTDMQELLAHFGRWLRAF